MLYAFDTISRCMVSADEVSKNNIDEPFRYECLCCGEEVHIAAARSRKMVSHFRHLRGNSDKDCELYLGSLMQTGSGIESAIAVAQKRARSHAEILFDTEQQLFYFSISFSEEKIAEYQDGDCELLIRTGPDHIMKPTLINHFNFAPDSSVRFPLKLSSNVCSLSIRSRNDTVHTITTQYEVLKPIDFPTFFKFQTSNDDSSLAKRHTDGIIYTDTRYYGIATKKNHIEKLFHYYPDVSIGEIEEISTLGGTIYGAEIQISAVSSELRDTMQYFGYALRKEERITILWPPVFLVDGELRCPSNKLFFSSSFEIRPKSNITCDFEQITCTNDVYAIDCFDSLRISKTNGITTQVSFEKQNLPVSNVEPQNEITTFVKVQDDHEFFYWGKEGCRLLSPGSYHLTESSKIVRCKQTYPEIIYSLPIFQRPNAVKRLMDVRRYYNVSIAFSNDYIAGVHLSKVAEIYIEDCRRTGVINAKALEFIKAGLI